MAFLVSVGFYALAVGLVVLAVPRRLVGAQGRRIAVLAIVGGLALMGYGGAVLSMRVPDIASTAAGPGAAAPSWGR